MLLLASSVAVSSSDGRRRALRRRCAVPWSPRLRRCRRLLVVGLAVRLRRRCSANAVRQRLLSVAWSCQRPSDSSDCSLTVRAWPTATVRETADSPMFSVVSGSDCHTPRVHLFAWERAFSPRSMQRTRCSTTSSVDDIRVLANAELHDVFRSSDALCQHALALELDALTEIDARGSHEIEGARSAAAYAAWQTPITQADARALVLAGRALPSMPLVAEAFQAGAVTVGQLQLLARCQVINPDAFETRRGRAARSHREVRHAGPRIDLQALATLRGSGRVVQRRRATCRVAAR